MPSIRCGRRYTHTRRCCRACVVLVIAVAQEMLKRLEHGKNVFDSDEEGGAAARRAVFAVLLASVVSGPQTTNRDPTTMSSAVRAFSYGCE